MPEATNAKDGTMPFIAHIRELRRRVIGSAIVLTVAFGLSFWQYDNYVGYLLEPLGKNLSFHYILDTFSLRLKISLYAALALSAPVHLFNIVAFIVPALTGKEKTILFSCLGASVVLSAAGAAMAFFLVIPWTVDFLTHQGRVGNVTMNQNVVRNVMLEIKIILSFILLFQSPIVLEAAMAMNLVSRRALLKSSRYIIVFIFIIAAIFTPQDWISQLAVAVPLILFFYLSILVAKICGFGEAQSDC